MGTCFLFTLLRLRKVGKTEMNSTYPLETDWFSCDETEFCLVSDPFIFSSNLGGYIFMLCTSSNLLCSWSQKVPVKVHSSICHNKLFHQPLQYQVVTCICCLQRHVTAPHLENTSKIGSPVTMYYLHAI